ncbi:MAG: hypothetical protein ACK5L3_05015, partial [Oscillospiraceae bacterium]
MRECILALDIGTSSTKALAVARGGESVSCKTVLQNTAPTALNFYENAINAAARCIAENSLAPTAVCLTSQVGSYLMY